MYITNNVANTYNVEMNEDEYKVLSKVFDRLIFNPNGVSNAFKFSNDEIKIVKSISGQFHATDRPKSITELRKQISIKTVPNNGLVDLYKRGQ